MPNKPSYTWPAHERAKQTIVELSRVLIASRRKLMGRNIMGECIHCHTKYVHKKRCIIAKIEAALTMAAP